MTRPMAIIALAIFYLVVWANVTEPDKVVVTKVWHPKPGCLDKGHRWCKKETDKWRWLKF